MVGVRAPAWGRRAGRECAGRSAGFERAVRGRRLSGRERAPGRRVSGGADPKAAVAAVTEAAEAAAVGAGAGGCGVAMAVAERRRGSVTGTVTRVTSVSPRTGVPQRRHIDHSAGTGYLQVGHSTATLRTRLSPRSGSSALGRQIFSPSWADPPRRRLRHCVPISCRAESFEESARFDGVGEFRRILRRICETEKFGAGSEKAVAGETATCETATGETATGETATGVPGFGKTLVRCAVRSTARPAPVGAGRRVPRPRP